MPIHSLRALLTAAAVVPLIWIGIVLIEKLHGRGALVPALVIWAVVLTADLGVAVWSLTRSRRHRIERRPEPTVGRK